MYSLEKSRTQTIPWRLAVSFGVGEARTRPGELMEDDNQAAWLPVGSLLQAGQPDLHLAVARHLDGVAASEGVGAGGGPDATWRANRERRPSHVVACRQPDSYLATTRHLDGVAAGEGVAAGGRSDSTPACLRRQAATGQRALYGADADGPGRLAR
jgi:hypothetical protein